MASLIDIRAHADTDYPATGDTRRARPRAMDVAIEASLSGLITGMVCGFIAGAFLSVTAALVAGMLAAILNVRGRMWDIDIQDAPLSELLPPVALSSATLGLIFVAGSMSTAFAGAFVAAPVAAVLSGFAVAHRAWSR